MEIKTSEEIAQRYQELTRITPTDKRYIWRTQKKWVAIDDLIVFIKEFQSKKKQVTDKILIQEELKSKIIDVLSRK